MKIFSTAIAVMTIASAAWAQAGAASQPADAPPAATQPAGIDEPFEATAMTVVGNVLYAMPGADGKPGEFKPVKEGDKLPAGAIIQTRLRSKVVLSFGPDTVVLIDRVTMASIDQFHRTGDPRRSSWAWGTGSSVRPRWKPRFAVT